MNTIKVYDKDGNALKALALEAGAAYLRASSAADAVETLKNDACTCAFVHLEEEDWKHLIRNLSESRVALRFSTVGFPPTLPCGPHSNAFHSCLSTGDGGLNRTQ